MQMLNPTTDQPAYYTWALGAVNIAGLRAQPGSQILINNNLFTWSAGHGIRATFFAFVPATSGNTATTPALLSITDNTFVGGGMAGGPSNAFPKQTICSLMILTPCNTQQPNVQWMEYNTVTSAASANYCGNAEGGTFIFQNNEVFKQQTWHGVNDYLVTGGVTIYQRYGGAASASTLMGLQFPTVSASARLPNVITISGNTLGSTTTVTTTVPSGTSSYVCGYVVNAITLFNSDLSFDGSSITIANNNYALGDAASAIAVPQSQQAFLLLDNVKMNKGGKLVVVNNVGERASGSVPPAVFMKESNNVMPTTAPANTRLTAFCGNNHFTGGNPFGNTNQVADYVTTNFGVSNISSVNGLRLNCYKCPCMAVSGDGNFCDTQQPVCCGITYDNVFRVDCGGDMSKANPFPMAPP